MSLTANKLMLHIGTGKAGTTSIQQSLTTLNETESPVKILKSFGFPNARLLAMSTGSQQSHLYFVKKHKVVSQGDFEKNTQTIWENTQKEVSGFHGETFVASSEFIGAMIRGNHIETLMSQLRNIFSEIEIVVYLRDQRSFLRSLWAQSVKGPNKSTVSFNDFMNNLSQNSYLWNYSIFLKDWLDVAGSNLNVTMFDANCLFKGDIVADFYKKAGMGDFKFAQASRANVSPSFEALEKIRLENLMRQNPNLTQGKPESVKKISEFDYESLVLDAVSDGNLWVNETFFKNEPVKLPTQ